MPLQTQEITLPFVKGVETKLDAKLVDGGSLLELENAAFAKDGTPDRRDAYAELDGSILDESPSFVAQHRDELLTVAGKSLFSYSPALDEQSLKGTVSPCVLAKTSIRKTSEFADSIDVAILNGLACYVWREVHRSAPGSITVLGVYATVVDLETGAAVFGPEQIDANNVHSPRVVGLSAEGPTDAATFAITYIGDAGVPALAGKLFGIAIPLATLTASTPVVLRADVTGFLTDMVAQGGTVAHVHQSGGTGAAFRGVLLAYSAGLLVVRAGPVTCLPTSTISDAAFKSVAVVAFPNATLGVYGLARTGSALKGIWAGTMTWTPTTISAGVTMVQKDDVLSPPVSNALLSTITATVHGDLAMVYADQAGDISATTPGTRTPVRVIGINSSNATVLPPRTLITSYSVPSGPCGPYIAGKPIVADGETYLPMYVGSDVTGGSNLQCTWLLVDSEGSIVGRALYGSYGLWSELGGGGVQYMATSSPALSAYSFLCPAAERGQLAFSEGPIVNATPVGVSALTVNFDRPRSAAQVGPNTFFSGALVTQYDGASVTEAGFHLFPEGLATTVAAGSLTGTYQYCALYEWQDNSGQRHQSAPSLPVSVSPSSQNVTVTLPALSITARTGVTVVLFRTLNNGTTFYRLNSILNPLSNTPTVAASATVNYTDSAADATIEDNEILYTTSGELDHLAPGPCTAVAAHQTRLWMVGLEDPGSFAYSQAYVPNSGLAFSDALTGNVPQEIGGLVAVGVLDDKAILYTGSRKAVIFGTGPLANGLQNGYSTPQLLPTDVGCIDPRSVVNVPSGQMYQSAHGLYLLNRALQDEYIGSPVEEFILGNEVVAAVPAKDKSQVRFAVMNRERATGAVVGAPGLGLGLGSSVVAYDSQFQQWDRHVTQADALFAGACVWDDRCTYADATVTPPDTSGALGVAVAAPGIMLGSDGTAGRIAQDTPGSFYDFGTDEIRVTLATQWIRLGQLSGFERVRRLVVNGSFSADSAVSIGVCVNYDDTVVYTATLDSTGAVATGDVVQIRHHVRTQKCQAIRFIITDTPAANSSGAGCNYSGITLELGMKKGVAKLPASAST